MSFKINKTQVADVLSALAGFFTRNPKAVSVVVSYVVLAGAYFGLHLTAAEVTAVGVVIVPLVLAYFHVSVKAQLRAKGAKAALSKLPPR